MFLSVKTKYLQRNTFYKKSFNNHPSIFKSWFTFCSDVHNYQTVTSTDKRFKPSCRTDSLGKVSITIGAINSWNKTQHQLAICHWKHIAKPKLKVYFPKKCIKVIDEVERDKHKFNWNKFNYTNQIY